MTSRDRLICSARELLWERGYVGTSPRAIQMRAGTGQGSMYHHFDGKHGLALDALSASAQEMRSRAEAVLAGPGPALDRVLVYLRLERDALKGCPVGGLVQDPDVMADAELRQPVADFLSWLTDRLTDLVTEAQRDAEVPPDLDPVATATALAATIQGGYVLARASHDPAAQVRAIEGMVGLLIRKDT